VEEKTRNYMTDEYATRQDGRDLMCHNTETMGILAENLKGQHDNNNITLEAKTHYKVNMNRAINDSDKEIKGRRY
jgi:hypothetical protein